MPRLVLQSVKPGLLRQLGFFSAAALVISNMVGAGIFSTTGFLAGNLGSAWMILLCWAVGALFAFAGALSYSELGINFPSSGGEYVYLTRAFGPEWGFMTGWVSFFAGFSAPIAAAALTFSDYLGHFVPALHMSHDSVRIGGGVFSIRVGGAQVVASTLIAAFTALNCLGVGRTAKVQNVLTSIKLVALVGFVILGMAAGSGDWSHITGPSRGGSNLLMQFFVSLLWVVWAYSGWNAATYVAEEVRNPEHTLPAALAAGTGIVALLYLGLNVVFLYSTPIPQLAEQATRGEIAIGSQAALNLFGPRISGLFSGLMALAIVSSVNAMVTVGPRVYYAMAKNRAFLPAAAMVHPRWHTPVVAIVSQGLCAILMTLTPFPDLVIYIGLSLTLFSVLTVASLFVFRRKRPAWQSLKALNFAWPLIPASYIVVGACMMTYGVVKHPVASLTAFVTVGAGGLAYRLGLGARPA